MTAPAYRDAHLHLLEHGFSLLTPSAADARSLDDVLAIVASAAHDPPADGWIRVRSLRPQGIREQRFPTRHELDDASNGAKVIVQAVDIHSMTASTAALHAAGITKDTPDPPKGVIERETGAGQGNGPNGVLLEDASKLIWNAIPEPDLDTRAAALRAAIADLNAKGFTEAHEMHARPGLISAIDHCLRTTGDETFDRFTLVLYAVPDHYDNARKMWQALPDPDAGPVRWGGMKLFLDGTLNSRTAFMLEPFADPVPGHERGIPNFSDDELRELFALHAERNDASNVACHAIGDAAVRQVLDAYDDTAADTPRFGLRVEHAQFVHPDDPPRFFRTRSGSVRATPIIVSMQPCHLLIDLEPMRRLLPNHADHSFPLASFTDAATDAGLTPADVIWMGSDTPVVPPSVEDNIQAAVHRRPESSPADQALGMTQAVSREDVLSMHTTSAGPAADWLNIADRSAP